MIHRDQDDGAGTNKLDATRQALREQVAAREHGEHLLQEAQATEAIQRIDGEKEAVEHALQRVQEEMAIERASRQMAEQERDEAVVARQGAEERSGKMRAAYDAQVAPQAPPRPHS